MRTEFVNIIRDLVEFVKKKDPRYKRIVEN